MAENEELLESPAATAVDEPLPSQDELPPDHRSGFVAIVGRPNVGKSTLLNAWLGQKIAIITPKPQTTRNRLLGILTRPDAQVIFQDTPGLHRPRTRLGDFMIEQAEQAISGTDIICLVVDGSVPPTSADRMVAERVLQEANDTPVVLAINKLDLIAPELVEERLAAYRALVPTASEWVLISALDPTARADLLQCIIHLLPPGPRFYPPDQVTDLQERFVVAELVREQVLHATYQEVPHGVAVAVKEFKRRSEDMTYINATIYVERESHKAILLGAQGRVIKQIGQTARREIEQLVGTRVYLDLWVKVWKNWRKRDDRLRWLGYAPPAPEKPSGKGSRRKRRKP